jgi:ubiquinone/menaquinone biosynthesis C-methylase UbiE
MRRMGHADPPLPAAVFTAAGAERYEAWFSTPFGRRADRVERSILAALLAEFEGASTLLDAGCGTGHFADLWHSLELAAVGLDVSAGMLQFTRKHRPEFPVVLGDVTALPFKDHSFDVVALVTVLEFLTAPQRALAEAGRVAREGIVLGVLNSQSPVAWWRRASGSRSYRNARFFSLAELERIVRCSLGNRELAVRRKTGLYPLPWLDSFTTGTLGAFMGMSVRFTGDYRRPPTGRPQAMDVSHRA